MDMWCIPHYSHRLDGIHCGDPAGQTEGKLYAVKRAAKDF